MVILKTMSRQTKNKTMNAGLALMMGVAAFTPVMAMDVGVASAAVGVFEGGTGTISDPYQIKTPIQLNAIRNDVKAHYKLVGDVDLTGINWTPVETFTGSLDGGNHTIKNLNMTVVGTEYTGFINTLKGVIKNVNFTGVTADLNGRFSGVLAGSMGQGTVVDNVQIDGVLNGSYTGGSGGLGMLAGLTSSAVDITVNNVVLRGSIKSKASLTAGGLIGSVRDINISNSEAHVDMDIAGGTVGGFIGSNNISKFTVKNSIATGNITTSGSAGGFIGAMDKRDLVTIIASSYATGNVTGGTVGGFAGSVASDSGLSKPVAIVDAYATGDVHATNPPNPDPWNRTYYHAGGFAGKGGAVHQVYATGDVTTSGRVHSGGLYGVDGYRLGGNHGYALNKNVDSGKIIGIGNEYSPGGFASAYTYEGSGITDNTPKLSPDELTKRQTYEFNGFEFGSTGDAVWGIDEGESLPYLLFSSERTKFNPDSGEWVTSTSETTVPGGGSGGNSGGGLGTDQNATLLLNGGSLTLDVPAITPMGLIKLTPQAQKVTTGFTDTFGVSDARGTGEGWRLAVNATPFEVVEPEAGFAPGTSANKLPAGTLTLKPLAYIERLGTGIGTDPASKLPMDSIIDSGAVTVANANVNEGMGDFRLSFAEDALGLIIDSATAKIDKVNYPDSSTPYESTVTWTLVTGP